MKKMRLNGTKQKQKNNRFQIRSEIAREKDTQKSTSSRPKIQVHNSDKNDNINFVSQLTNSHSVRENLANYKIKEEKKNTKKVKENVCLKLC